MTTRACSAGFLLDGAGLIVHSGIAEVLADVDKDGDVVISIVAGLGCWMRTVDTKYGADWEQH